MARRSSPPRQGSRGSGARSLRLRSSTASPAAAPLTEEGFDHQVGLRLWRDAMARVQGSRDRILECEDFVMGDLSLEPAGALARDPNWESLVYTSPQRKELLINMINALAEVEPIFEKTAPNDNKTTVERNEQTEACLEALRKELIDWPQMIGRGTAQAEYATITMLHENHWEALPEFEDLPLSPSEWAKLTRSEKSTYRPRGSGSSTVYVRPRRTYWRDGEGRPAEHPEYSGRRSGRKTKAAWQRDIEDAMAAKPPFLVRIISPLDCAPVFTTQIDGKRRLAALMVRTLMEEDALLEMNFNWNRSGKDGRPLMIPRGFSRTNAVGSNGKLWFYEFYVRIKGDPCVAYMVGGQETWREYADGATEPAIINLKREWGFTRLPITYPYGLNLPFDDPDDRGVPYMEPVKSALMGFEALITSMQYTAYRRGTSKIAIRPDPQVPAAAYLTPAGDALKNFDIDPDADVITLPGPTQILAPIEHSADTRFLVDVTSREVDNATPADEAMGSGQAPSGRAASLMHTYARSSKRMIPEESRASVEEIGSFLLEWACCFMRKKKLKAIPIDANLPADPSVGREKDTTQRLELREDFIGTNYKVTAKWPATNNPVEVNQETILYEKGLGSFDDVQEKRGKTNPLHERIKITNDRYWASPEGVAELNAYAARKRADVEKAKKLDMILKQQLTPDGQGPMDALAPEFENTYGGPRVTDFGQLQRAGQIGGDMQVAEQGRAAAAASAAAANGATQPTPVGAV